MGSSNFSKIQSAYRSGCSTETAPLSILDGLYQAIDNKETAVLVSLDLSAAFDTISHDILLNRLDVEFGVRGLLRWPGLNHICQTVNSLSRSGGIVPDLCRTVIKWS